MEHAGKKEEGGLGKRKEIVPVLYKENAFTENEAFVRMMEDPLVYIKQKE